MYAVMNDSVPDVETPWQATCGDGLGELKSVPRWLQGCWRREYIRQTFREPKPTDTAEETVVFYLQGERLCVDIRINTAAQRKASDAWGAAVDSGVPFVDCFAGVAVQEELPGDGGEVMNWHPLFSLPGDAFQIDDEGVRTWLAKVQSAPSATEDRGRVHEKTQTASGAVEAWLEFDVEGGSGVYEERWVSTTDLRGGGAGPVTTAVESSSAPMHERIAVRSGKGGESVFEIVVRVGRIFARASAQHFCIGQADDASGKVEILHSTDEQLIGTIVDASEFA
mmetsp:Transcript_18042/g.50108  ORF Transcript_18042/g.50108 Transcript_18042/m.50108 type:complete len:281 (-) Transcript_18042:234-1076(-)|eukprot:CAMPEP_0177397750 /NCGR_PEP_ID=MMETSP0368-20130122/57500_1 /TAXON_ID=447022 ORGANISM="Scrippsiella hangoei-like, Strain SHHI-4" /NCGR_SAMPLE_ID=MMETSP0368 /ASSEMBLY_ACC=CAM_ASM_000363 /LENGTH=280 /DNA_ID=CAMNT_0018864719 /DNA_START=21 /DNA_END=863 /DNA_ORIENTATION=-